MPKKIKARVGQKNDVGPTGSGVPGGDDGATGHVTGAPDSLAEPVNATDLTPEDVLASAEDLEDFTITDRNDPRLGLTGVPNHPPEDWAADTGPTVNRDAVEEEVELPPESEPDVEEP